MGSKHLVKQLRVHGDPRIEERDARAKFGWKREEAERLLDDEMVALVDLQKRLFADKSASLLIVLQAMDAAGKDSTIRAVLSGLNPAGVDVQPFGVPTDEELGHDYLWRIHRHTPEDGYIAVFNRSHYEDVLIARVKKLVPKSVWKKRYRHIREFERMLAEEGTHIVKIFLNVSKDKQKERFEERLHRPDKNWKFRAGDLDDRALWGDYMQAYSEAIEETSTKHAPWYVVPADRKWARNVCIARILRHHLEQIDPQYPEPDPDIDFDNIVVT
ncbi:PPK2 family polyphosphate kinase [Ilumatobacter nonamiensis]|uniref:PPK2 family polyphosphate kinase n=1 Tax=Ilumatobacter nonamiensis TaxID=467093 RepID=UPI00034AC8CA|nr:PPK2 family polyphosphate kinase [Ilumatobacter nonamiensis]